MSEEARIAPQLASFLSERWGADVAISDMKKMVGGAARTTWRCTATKPGAGEERLVFRTHGAGDGALHLSSEETEFNVMKAAYGAGIPAPEPFFFEEDERWLGEGFTILAEVPDCEVAIGSFDAAQRVTMADDLWSILGDIAKLDVDALGLDDVLERTTCEDTARHELNAWAAVFREHAVHPDPVGEAAIRWMERNLPPPAQKLALVHGDYRVGNVLFGRSGRVEAVLDWEMAHLGDPLEDLAWSLDPRQDVDRAELAGGLAPYERAVALWKDASGLEVDPAALRWWQVFAAFKGLAIWTKAAGIFATQSPKRPALARMGWVLSERQQRVLADYLSPHSPGRLFEYRP